MREMYFRVRGGRKAKEEGANGIINLSIKYNWVELSDKYKYLVSVEISGMLIKR